jgi:hypothetical protein
MPGTASSDSFGAHAVAIAALGNSLYAIAWRGAGLGGGQVLRGGTFTTEGTYQTLALGLGDDSLPAVCALPGQETLFVFAH